MTMNVLQQLQLVKFRFNVFGAPLLVRIDHRAVRQLLKILILLADRLCDCVSCQNLICAPLPVRTVEWKCKWTQQCESEGTNNFWD